MAREHAAILHLGNGETSMQQMRRLRARMWECFSENSGLQQAAFHLKPSEVRAAEAEIEDTVRDIAMALTGKEIRFVRSRT